MKVLFVCHFNVGRSQMAKAYYNLYTKSENAEAAGTSVNEPGETLQHRKDTGDSKHFFLFDVMLADGLDISGYKRLPLSQDMLPEYDYVISMASRTQSPNWLLLSPNYYFWDVKDPRGQNFEVTLRTRDSIKNKVKHLIQTGKPD